MRTYVLCQSAKPQTNDNSWEFFSLSKEIVQLSICVAVLYNRKLRLRNLAIGLEITRNLFNTAWAPNPLIYKTDPEYASKLSILFPCHSALLGHSLNSFELKFSLTTRNIHWDPAFKNSKVNEPLHSITNSQAFVI